MGTGSTEWEGNLFNCLENGIVLRHERYTPGPANGECNGGAVVAQSVGVENDCYTSRLTFTVSPTFYNKTVSCVHSSSLGLTTIGTSVIRFMEG